MHIQHDNAVARRYRMVKLAVLVVVAIALPALGAWFKQRRLSSQVEMVAMPTALPTPKPTASAPSTLLNFSSQRAYKLIDGTVYSFMEGVDGKSASLAVADEAGIFTRVPRRIPGKNDTAQPAGNTFLYNLGDFIGSRTQDFWFHEPSHHFFMVEYRSLSADRTQSVFEVAFEPDEQGEYTKVAYKKLLVTWPLQYYETTDIIDYLPEKRTLMLHSGWGDGCGGGGVIQLLNTQSQKLTPVVELGFGCGQGPSFGGLTDDGQIILGKRSVTTEQGDADEHLLSIYTLDPFTKRTQVLTSDVQLLKPYRLENNSYTYEPKKMKAAAGRILLRSQATPEDEQTYQFDPAAQQITVFEWPQK